ncbi:hypothetical protein M2D63_001180 [Pseudomonas sp. BJa5]|uniref:hypothetical protein n=1 Tax=Pseudomonas sp. BJa5 TaxID=2936270 RepID=UPI002559C721|nr:hypothetical protein [Pseudomonas sp. BGr12]MDL2419728.1 hypothetical protein [Pseudomonas sp. BGr12]
MTQLTPLQCLILNLAEGGIAGTALRASVMRAHPGLTDSEYLSALLLLQNQQRLIGADTAGLWIFFSICADDSEADAPEYSPQFAERIIAADAGEWTEVCPDELIAELDAMLAQARARQKPGA